MIKAWFTTTIQRQAIHRGTFTRFPTSCCHPSIRHQLEQPCEPFVWTKPANEILERKNQTQPTSNPDR